MQVKFDSYIENGRLIMVTISYNGDRKVVTENIISISRAKEIVKELQLNISLLEFKESIK